MKMKKSVLVNKIMILKIQNIDHRSNFPELDECDPRGWQTKAREEET
jgi:hypothetical protein